jgi:transposase InsO family protein
MSVMVRIPWQKTLSRPRKEPIRWHRGNGKYEIYCAPLDSLNLESILTHCKSVPHLIKRAVVSAAHLGPALFEVFPRTLEQEIEDAWAPAVATLGANPDQSVENFELALKAFIAAHATTRDRHALVQQLSHPIKPREMAVQVFQHRLLELNNSVELLPGTSAQLTQDQLKQAFFDGMPKEWRNRFIAGGSRFELLSFAEVVAYFRDMEDISRNAPPSEPKTSKRPMAEMDGRKPRTSKDKKRKFLQREKTSKPGNSGRKTIADDYQCPLHPQGTHTWGQCRTRTQLAKSKATGGDKGKSQQKKSQSFSAVHDEKVDALSGEEGTPLSNPSVADMLLPLDEYLTPGNIAFTSQDSDGEDTSVFKAFCLTVDNSNADGMEAAPIVGDERMPNSNTCHRMKLLPIGILSVASLQGQITKRPFRVLFDSGSMLTLINSRVLPPEVVPHELARPISLFTVGGMVELRHGVCLHTLRFPELSPTRSYVKTVEAVVCHHTRNYDIILGIDVMVPAGIDVHPSNQTIQWGDLSVPWRSPSSLSDKGFPGSLKQVIDHLAPEPQFDSFSVQLGAQEILSSKYEQVDTDTTAQQQRHLSQRQRGQLAETLRRYTTLFSGKLGCYPRKVRLDYNEDATPFHCRPYPVPHAHRKVFKEELDRLVELGVLSKTGPAKFLSPTFIIPKKDGRVRFVSDFRKLNKIIKRKVYHLPIIHDILRKRSGYRYFTKLDISMQYYTFELEEASKELCTICTPFGNYQYNRLPMGVKQAPDIAQEIMEELLRPYDESDVYIDDIGIFSSTWDEHLYSLDRILRLLQENNFTVNPLKCEWGVQETDWLGYWLTPEGLKPWKKKVDPVLAIQPPKTVSELRSFIGSIQFYRDMYRRRSHILAPLTSQTGRRQLTWTSECEQAFKAAKAMIAAEAFLQYPDHNKPFYIYADASDYQLGSVIMQEGKPVAFFSRKLTSAQRNYTTGEKELLSIVETFKEYRTMLYGCQEIHVYTDHKNLTYQNLQTQRVLRWRLFIEEYGPIFHYIEGSKNTAADALSRLPFVEQQHTHPSCSSLTVGDTNTSFYSMAMDDDELYDCFVHLPDQLGVPFQLDYQVIAQAQVQDATLLRQRQAQPLTIQQRLYAPGTSLYCYVATPGGEGKIYLPDCLLKDTVRWYHLALGHCGTTRLADTLRMHFHNPRLQQTCVEEVRICDPCQRYKNVGRGHGETASRDAPLLPWQDVAVDLIGPWTLTVGIHKLKFSALTIMDMATNLVDMVRITNKTAAHVALHFENAWLARYPRPVNVIHDQGGEFLGHEFQERLRVHNIVSKPTTAKNPRANAVCERMHQAVGNTLRVLSTMDPPQGAVHAEQLVDTAIAEAVYATRCTYSSALKTTPGGLAFGRDMIMNIPLVTDLQQLQKRRQELVNRRLLAANAKRFSFDYQIGDEVLKLIFQPDKLDPRASGPFTITRVHTNGTVTIETSPGVIERINIRRLKPYRR